MKLTFRLDVDEDGWPPVAAESVWCEEVGDLYRICNTPFFVKGIAFGDVVRVKSVGNNEVTLDDVIEQSGNSTIWLYFQKEGIACAMLADLGDLGCGYEGSALDGYFSVNVPKAVDIDKVVNVFTSLEESGDLFVAYPADRH